MPHRLPSVLAGNLACLASARWDQLAEVIVVVDTCRERIDLGLEDELSGILGGVKLRFEYYSEAQSRAADRLLLPYVYSWLSWSIGLGLCTTRTALLHDYDALVLSNAIESRYHTFVGSGASVQGIRWYSTNGIRIEDRLATTFEAFVDVGWLRSFRPVRMFNKIGCVGGRSVDFDTLLDLQARELSPEKRQVEPMGPDDLVHPSQMVHQFTMFRKFPGKVLPCHSLPMIPFFQFLSGREEALRTATERVVTRKGRSIELLGDGTSMNFELLRTQHVDWDLKQMVQTCVRRGIEPSPELYAYGSALYELAGAGREEHWRGDFAHEQREWIQASGSGAGRV